MQNPKRVLLELRSELKRVADPRKAPAMQRYIEPSLDSKEFFLRKAIGWALRQYAWTDPREIQRYIRAHDSRLSALSKREALRNIE
jgi:3-methyladenine DNA glycosylase AlkD